MADPTREFEGEMKWRAQVDPNERDELLSHDEVEDDDGGEGSDVELELDLRDIPYSERAASERPLRSSSVRRTAASAATSGVRYGELRRGVMVAAKYRVGGVVRRGETAVTVRAFHVELGQNVTITSLRPECARRPSVTSRFLNDARSAARLDSEHAARILDVGWLESGVPFFVAEALEGWTLQEVLAVRGALPVQEAVEYVIQAADAISDAHRLGIAHGGLNLTNVVLSRRPDGSPRIKVSGLGDRSQASLGSFDDRAQSRERPNEFIAVLPYLAPEQIRNSDAVDAKTDVWALGGILHALITGLPPFRASSKAALLAAIVADPPAALDASANDVAFGLGQAAQHCLEKEAEQRFASVADFVVALKPYASGDALGSVERISRNTQRFTEPPPLPIPRVRAIVPVVASPVRAAPPSFPGPSWLVAGAFIGALVGGATAVVAGAMHLGDRPFAPQSEPASAIASPKLEPTRLPVASAVAMPTAAKSPSTTSKASSSAHGESGTAVVIHDSLAWRPPVAVATTEPAPKKAETHEATSTTARATVGSASAPPKDLFDDTR
jgi:serine/threonine-protein kinase